MSEHNLLVEVHGTGGSGKSTVVRRLVRDELGCSASPEYLEVLEPWVVNTLSKGTCLYDGGTLEPFDGLDATIEEAAHRLAARRTVRQVGELHLHAHGLLGLAGSYRTECGGCDSISAGVDLYYEVADRLLRRGCDVLMEGRLLSNCAIARPLRYLEQLRVFLIDPDPAASLAATIERRAHNGKETTPERAANILANITKEAVGARNQSRRLAEHGARTMLIPMAKRDALPGLLASLLRREWDIPCTK